MSKEDLIPYGPNNPPPGKGRPPGSRNRKTIVMEALEALDKKSGLPNVDAMTYAVIRRAMKGDVFAYKELLDSGFGKVADKQEIFPMAPLEVKRLDDDVYKSAALQVPEAKVPDQVGSEGGSQADPVVPDNGQPKDPAKN